VLATARKALRPGGRLLLVEPNWKHRFQGRDASDEYGVTEMGYSPRRLKRLLREAGFVETSPAFTTTAAPLHQQPARDRRAHCRAAVYRRSASSGRRPGCGATAP